MKKVLLGYGAVLLLASVPAEAQNLPPAFGWLRTALENTMAQGLPPYGKTDAAPQQPTPVVETKGEPNFAQELQRPVPQDPGPNDSSHP